MNRSNRAAFNTVSNVGGFLVPLMVNFIITPIVLRFLGEEGYGLQVLALVVSGYLTFMDLGMDIPITKLLAEDNAKKDYISSNRLLNSTLVLYLVIGFLGFILISFSRNFLVSTVFNIPKHQFNEARCVFLLAGIGFALNIFASWGRAALNGIQRYDVNTFIRITTMVAASIIGIVALYLGYGLVGFVFIRVISYAVAALLCFYATYRLVPNYKVKLKIDKNTLRRIRGYVGMGIVLRITAFFSGGFDRTLISIWAGVSAVTVYSIQWSILSPVSGLMDSIVAFFFPMASELHSAGRLEELRSIFKRILKFSVAVALLVFPMLLLYGNIFLKLWVGKSIAEQSQYLLPLLIISIMVGNLMVGLLNEVVVGTGKLRSFMVYKVSRTTVLAVGCLIFIRLFGLIGAGLAFLIANLADIGLFIFALKNYLKISFYEIFKFSYRNPLILSVIVSTVGLLVKPYVNSWLSLVIVIGLLGVVYILGGFAMGVFGETEKKVVAHFRNILLNSSKRITAEGR